MHGQSTHAVALRRSNTGSAQLETGIDHRTVGGEADGEGTRVGNEGADIHQRARRGAVARIQQSAIGVVAVVDIEVVAAALTPIGSRQYEQRVGRSGIDRHCGIAIVGIVAVGAAVVVDSVAAAADDIGAGDRHIVVVARTDGDRAAPHAVFTAAVGTHIHIIHHAHGEAGKHIGGVAIHGDNVLRSGVGVETNRAIGNFVGITARSVHPRHPCRVAAYRVGIKADGCNTFRQIDAAGVQLVASILDAAVRGEADG